MKRTNCESRNKTFYVTTSTFWCISEKFSHSIFKSRRCCSVNPSFHIGESHRITKSLPLVVADGYQFMHFLIASVKAFCDGILLEKKAMNGKIRNAVYEKDQAMWATKCLVMFPYLWSPEAEGLCTTCLTPSCRGEKQRLISILPL